jgi:DNA anti-recombination protein RmuC
MTEPKGQFKNGVWVKEPEPSAAPVDASVIDKRFTEATKSVISSIDDVMKVTHDLVTTEEGKQYIEKTIKDTQTQIQKSFDEIMSRVKTEMGKKVNELNKTVNELDKKVKQAK